MKIAILAAGAAGRFCGTCLHDNTLAAALIAAGEDVLLIPTYTPLRTDEVNVSEKRVFFGGVNVFLQQKSALFRHTPWFVDRWLDAPWLLDWLSKRSSGMEAAQLGDLTVSTLRGYEGNQRKELTKLVQWLRTHVKPDVVHLTNSMLAGAAATLRGELGVPVVCSLSGEDIFLEQLREPHYGRARELLRSSCRNVDGFVALNRYFADYMTEYLSVDRAKIEVIRHGLNLQGHGTAAQRGSRDRFTIGYFARVAVEKGLHFLVEAFIQLCRDPSLPPLRLRVAGYMAPSDRPYFDSVLARIQEEGLSGRFEHCGELSRTEKIAFLQSLDAMSVPTVYRESKGISVLEGMANGVPMVLPAHGAFPELIEDTGGGLLCEPLDVPSLAAALKRLILEPDLAAELGRRGRDAIHQRYTAQRMADETRRWYGSIISPAARASGKA